MKARIACLALIWLGGLALAAGCGDDETDPGTPTALGGGGSAPVLKPAGGSCVCDADCEGEGALCLLGMCLKRAYGFCDINDRAINCDPDFLCFDADIVADTGVCWPLYDAATCEGVENRHGVCSPVRGETCDANCGTACVADTVPETAAGSHCAENYECVTGPDPECWLDPGQHNRFIDGYCVGFECWTDEECGLDAACTRDLFTYGGDPIGSCVNTCGMDLDCRAGYACRSVDGWERTFCWPGCDAAATCPEGYACAGGSCFDEAFACSTDNPHGICPRGYWCDAGVCSDEPYVCTTGEADAFEPNDTRETATDAPSGDTYDLTICAGDEDWFKVTVPAGTLMRVGIDFLHARGDLDLVVYDSNGVYLGSRYPKSVMSYPYTSYRNWEWNTEYHAFYSENGGDTYYLRVVGYTPGSQLPTENQYGLHVDSYSYVDGPDCEAAGFSTDECRGHGVEGSGLLPFPLPDPNDSYIGDAYFWEDLASGRFARREAIMAIRYALHETMQAFPGTTPLGIGAMSQFDGATPYEEVDDSQHPGNSHAEGGNLDMGYFQTDGDNDMEIICGDGSTHNDGFCSSAAVDTHFVDLKRQAFFMAKLFDVPRIRVIGVDEIIGPLIRQSAQELNSLPDTDPQHVTNAEHAAFSKLAYGGGFSGWPFHHHHIHVSFQFWSSASWHPPTGDGEGQNTNSATRHRMVHPSAMHGSGVQPPALLPQQREPLKLRLLGTK